MKTKWKWSPKGVTILRQKKHGGPADFAWAKGYKAETLADTGEAFEEARNVYGVLLDAAEAFRTGKAESYAGAAARLRELQKELIAAGDAVKKAAGEFDAALEPRGALNLFGSEDADGALGFIAELVGKVQERAIKEQVPLGT